jgi:hypothetical protein
LLSRSRPISPMFPIFVPYCSRCLGGRSCISDRARCRRSRRSWKLRGATPGPRRARCWLGEVEIRRATNCHRERPATAGNRNDLNRRSPLHTPPRHFSAFVTNKNTCSIRRMGDPCVTLGWPLGGPWVALGWPKGHPNPIPIPIGRGSQNESPLRSSLIFLAKS